jgi:hypothetical protein
MSLSSRSSSSVTVFNLLPMSQGWGRRNKLMEAESKHISHVITPHVVIT